MESGEHTHQFEDLAQVVESKGFESSRSWGPGMLVDDAKEATDDFSVEPVRVVNSSVPERVIFCIDAHFHTHDAQQILLYIVQNYIELKSSLAVKTVDFAILMMGNGVQKYYPVSCKKEINNVMIAMSRLQLEETEPFDFSGVFTELAKIVELPDPSFYSDELPPPHVYHFIILFGRNVFIPTLQSPNAYYFLLQSPYVAFDLLYLYNIKLSNNKHKKIGKALQLLVDPNKGFFETSAIRSTRKGTNAKLVYRFMGHPLIRFPQNSAIFDHKTLFDIPTN